LGSRICSPGRELAMMSRSSLKRAELVGDSVIIRDSGALKRFDAADR
jgi:hypothetical protein